MAEELREALGLDEPRRVERAAKAFQQGGDTRKLKAECARGNPYVLAKLDSLGLEYVAGQSIVDHGRQTGHRMNTQTGTTCRDCYWVQPGGTIRRKR